MKDFLLFASGMITGGSIGVFVLAICVAAGKQTPQPNQKGDVHND